MLEATPVPVTESEAKQYYGITFVSVEFANSYQQVIDLGRSGIDKNYNGFFGFKWLEGKVGLLTCGKDINNVF
jgi:hypothetical protein